MLISLLLADVILSRQEVHEPVHTQYRIGQAPGASHALLTVACPLVCSACASRTFGCADSIPAALLVQTLSPPSPDSHTPLPSAASSSPSSRIDVGMAGSRRRCNRICKVHKGNQREREQQMITATSQNNSKRER